MGEISTAYVNVMPDFSGFMASAKKAKASFDRLAEAMARMQREVKALIAELEVPEVWEAFSLSLLNEPRPAYDPEDPENPKYLAAVQEQAATVARYLCAVHERREQARHTESKALDARYPARTH